MDGACLKTAYIGLGSNLGDRERQLRLAVAAIGQYGEIIATSKTYLTAPVLHPIMPFHGQADFLNACVALQTELDPHQLLGQLLRIERELGRYRGPLEVAWSPRAIDLDLLAVDDQVIDRDGLVLPHPRLHQRRFVLEPLSEIAPGWRHPLLDKAASELLEQLTTP